MRAPPAISICAPAYNEQANIDAFLDDCYQALTGSDAQGTIEYEVVVVDDGSTDATWERLSARAATWPQLKIVRHPTNLGLGPALRTVYNVASKPYIFIIGSDCQWRCADLWPMVAAYQQGADIVVGVRTNKRDIYTPFRMIISGSYRLATYALFGVDLRDPGSLKLAPAEVYTEPLTSESAFSEGERLVRAIRKGMSLAFVPCAFFPRGGGVATGARADVVLRAAGDLLRTFVTIRLLHR